MVSGKRFRFFDAQCAIEKAYWKSSWIFFRKYLVAELAIAVVAAVVSGVVSGMMSGQLVSWLAVATGVLSGLITIAIIFLLIVIFNAITAPYKIWIAQSSRIENLENELSPAFRIEDILSTDTTLKVKDKQGNVIDRYNGRYFQIRVTNTCVKNIKCKPFLISARKKINDTWAQSAIETMELEWGIQDKSEIELEHNIPHQINVLVRTDRENRLTFPKFIRGEQVPNSIYGYFSDLGAYELTIRVSSPNLQSQEITVIIDNCADWSKTSITRKN